MANYYNLNLTDKTDTSKIIGKMRIGADWKDPNESWLEIKSPVNSEVIGFTPIGKSVDIDEAVKQSINSRKLIDSLSIWERSKICFQISDVILKNKEELSNLLCLEQGKPLYKEAISEVEAAASSFRNWGEQAKWLETNFFLTQNANKRCFSILQPRGVYGIITPWNFPFNLPVTFLAPGFLAGNTMVWVPAPTTSLISKKLMDCIIEGGMPDGIINMVTGIGSEVGEAVVKHQGVDAVCFVGSSSTGEIVAKNGAGKHLILELGGNGPTIVLNDANLETAAKKIAIGCCLNAGQICTATERILVQKDIEKDFTNLIISEMKKFKLGNSLDKDTVLGPINNFPGKDKINLHLKDAIDSGAEIVFGGKFDETHGSPLYFEPTVITNLNKSNLLNVDETFGPVAPILSFKNDHDLFEIVKASPFGLFGSIFTKDLSKAFKYSEKLKCGNVNVNDMSCYWETHIPAGGASGTSSGYGRQGGRHTIQEMSDLKTITMDIE